MKQQPPSGFKSEPSKHVPWQSGGPNILTTPCTTGSASTRKRSASIDDTERANSKDIFEGEANESKRRKASLNVLSCGGKECTEAWRVPVNEVGTEGLSIMSTGPDGNLLLSFDMKTQSIVVFFKEQCLSIRYPCLELIPAYIHSIKRNSLKTKEDFKARLSLRDGPKKLHKIDIVFPTIKDWETFMEKIRLSCDQNILAIPETGYEMYSEPQMAVYITNFITRKAMAEMFGKGLWLEKKIEMSGTLVKMKTLETLEVE